MTRIKIFITALALLMGAAAMAQSDGHSESAPPVSGGTSTPMPAGYISTGTRSDETPAGAAAVTQSDPAAGPAEGTSTRLTRHPKGAKERHVRPLEMRRARRALKAKQ